MAGIDPIQTINTKIAGGDGVSVALNELGLHPQGFALPVGVPFRYVPTVVGGERVALEGTKVKGLEEMKAQAPLTLRREDGTAYAFALDPVLSVNGKNVIVRRYVAKGSVTGSVKESWSQDDWEVTIAGVLIGETAKELNEMVNALSEVLESGEVLRVENAWLNNGYGITQVVVESWQMPHTKGLTAQAYTIRCYSDSSINILEEVQ